jgi:hypothetical protein
LYATVVWAIGLVERRPGYRSGTQAGGSAYCTGKAHEVRPYGRPRAPRYMHEQRMLEMQISLYLYLFGKMASLYAKATFIVASHIEAFFIILIGKEQ